MAIEPKEPEDPTKTLAAGEVKRLMALYDAGASLEDWNVAYAKVVADVADRLRQRLGAGQHPWIESTAASAMRTVLRRVVSEGDQDRIAPPLRPSGPDALVGLLVLIAFDKVYEKKRRDVDDEAPDVSTAEREEEEQSQFANMAIGEEMEQQLSVLLARLRLLGGGQESLIYRLLYEKKAEIEDRSYEKIREMTGVTHHSLEKARNAVDQYGPNLIAASRRALENLARRLRIGR